MANDINQETGVFDATQNLSGRNCNEILREISNGHFQASAAQSDSQMSSGG